MKGSAQTLTAQPQQTGRNEHPVDQRSQFVRQADICRRFGISDETWRRWRAARRAPAPVPNVPGRPRWRVEDIEAFGCGLFRCDRRRRG